MSERKLGPSIFYSGSRSEIEEATLKFWETDPDGKAFAMIPSDPDKPALLGAQSTVGKEKLIGEIFALDDPAGDKIATRRDGELRGTIPFDKLSDAMSGLSVVSGPRSDGTPSDYRGLLAILGGSKKAAKNDAPVTLAFGPRSNPDGDFNAQILSPHFPRVDN